MRGTLDVHGLGVIGVRIIPADAGNTRAGSAKPARRQDHPRGCGEHIWAYCVGSKSWGSSPRMRGTLGLSVTPIGHDRIIPADAGNTLLSVSASCKALDHPRGCGEHPNLPWLWLWHPGSSPRIRGTLGVDTMAQAAPRIIPADTGNTQPRHQDTGHHEDHPRGCGEHPRIPDDRLPVPGSSPRMRGTRQRRWWCMTYSLDHPRGCGEHS